MTSWGLRTVPGFKDFYFEYQDYYIPAWTYNSVYYTVYIRCSGIVLLSVHRYLVISAPHSLATAIVQEAATWKIVMVYWTVPTLISIVILKDTDIHYDSLATMELVVPRQIIAVSFVYKLLVNLILLSSINSKLLNW